MNIHYLDMVRVGILVVAQTIVLSPVFVYSNIFSTCPNPPANLGVSFSNYQYPLSGMCLIGGYHLRTNYFVTSLVLETISFIFQNSGDQITGSNCSNPITGSEFSLSINCYGYIPCSDSCTSCTSTTVCTQCLSNMTLTNNMCCPLSHYSPSYGTCSPCPTGCNDCLSSLVCTACTLGYYLRNDTLCYLTCLATTFANNSTLTCDTCPSPCS